MEEVNVLMEMNHYGTAASRLYYALFYVVSALLVKGGHSSKTHEGTQRIFSREFIRTEIFPKLYGRVYANLFRLRQVGDYGDLEEVSKEDITAILPETKELILLIRKSLSR